MILLPQKSWGVKPTKTKGLGLFTKRVIKPGTIIGDYLGKVLRNRELDINIDPANFYLMYYHNNASIFPDLEIHGIHNINHSCTPNIALFIFQGHTLFFALRHIFPGEELTVSYMLSPQDEHCNPCPHICNCGSKVCKENMHLSKESYDLWQEFQKEMAKKDKRKRISYNSSLSKLTNYPKIISDNQVYSLFGITEKPPLINLSQKLLTVVETRRLIRKSGRVIDFPNLKQKVLGVENNQLIVS